MVPNWSFKAPDWSNETYNLLVADEIVDIPEIKLEELIEKSENFPVQFPVDTGRCKTLKQYVSNDILEKNINSVYPVIHENALFLCTKYILFKRKHGNSIEKDLYNSMTLKQFINRLLTKRAVKFMGKFDSYKLINGKKGSKNWESIGSLQEKSPLTLKDCLSYEEVKLSVFLSVSSYTYFVNIGDRKNKAVYTSNRDNIADTGVIIGLIGARLKKAKVMEYEEMVTDKNQNTEQNGYGVTLPNMHNFFSEFYEEKCMNYSETIEFKKTLPTDSNRYTEIDTDGKLFDNHIYYKRMTLTVDTLLMEANKRASDVNTTAFIHVVGLGLGVWKISPHQEKVYMDIFAERLRQLGSHIKHVSDIVFSYFKQTDCGGYKDGETFLMKNHPNGIKIHICKRNPHEKLKNSNAGKLLIVSYAWDGNALPGNEYWDGLLGSSGDSAAASSTQIAEIHNTHINPKASADNLRIVTNNGVISFKEYRDNITIDLKKK